MAGYSIRISSRTYSMLAAHTEFLAKVSTSAAEKLVDEFERTLAQIANNPMAFPFADDIDVFNIPAETYRKCTFGKRYKILFVVERTTIFVDAIIDTRKSNTTLY
ncbi:MAG: type II toxin-antitoxin system RelE/ParE family toxin [Defluviitaleaceae bacterium]|nr:type II toxin-antitoxin system RelE/ParE family toxin [Defluviitaleaceae bacterium]MCL2263735.1 type II toxin-antitoxin system RelE/ParE family toxin [Defluviitaleaceae bacterium]